MEAGEFRDDLFERLNGFQIQLRAFANMSDQDWRSAAVGLEGPSREKASSGIKKPITKALLERVLYENGLECESDNPTFWLQ
jgi:transcriptional regulator of acetoin/glycerol metabolism